MTTNTLAFAACQGDERAFEQLITAHQRQLYSIAYSYLRNEADALEVIQETVFRAWTKCAKLRDPSAFTPWLIRILIHCCIDEQKRQKRMTVKEVESIHSNAEMVSVQKMDLQIALENLKPKYRHVLILKYYHDMTITDIASVLNKPEGTIKTWLHQGLKKTRSRMNQGGEHYYGYTHPY